jgi:hypothetical protein
MSSGLADSLKAMAKHTAIKWDRLSKGGGLLYFWPIGY